MLGLFVVALLKPLLLIVYHDAEFDILLEVCREVVSSDEVFFDCLAESVEEVLYFGVICPVELVTQFRELSVVREDVVDSLFELLELFVGDALRVSFSERCCDLCDEIGIFRES